ncbi:MULTISPECIES: integrase arm-type DNA-binding domain-containing protein [Citrobacter]|uniref:tyrosine-type recombinase/integrase n=1 Tax=Citrobacter TaxID=544 RepID=UPI0016609B02|nr:MULTISPECIES: integrase arm-type DNA-binding domain-containing protein [Citrobacter]MBA4711757.1 integrase arm-type DNA-binding domain-containing protein [Citrobacter pasteurii]MBD0800281.1 integrase arm-type DNA-binding domain-containing protein [Citrobacter sp. C6_1]MBD0812821.1 integrase arm-type DNA-binding domain-containing protein [Citrobacter sp. C6_2]
MALTDTAIRKTKLTEKPFKLADSSGLYLLIKPNGSKLWYMKYRIDGKEKKLAFGPYPDVSLFKARQLRDAARAKIREGVDPSADKKIAQQKKKNGHTFRQIAMNWHGEHKHWSAHYANTIQRRLEMYVFPDIGDSLIDQITTETLLFTLRKVENKGFLEITARLKNYVTEIMRYAVKKQLIKSNPALDLDGEFTPPETSHYPALPLDKLPELLTRTDSYCGRLLTRYALKLSLLFFVRSSELRFARWSEIDWQQKLWVIPEEREQIENVKFSHRGTKMRTQHIVPLSDQAIAILKQVEALSGHLVFVFPGEYDQDKCMSDNTVNKALRVMGYDTKKEICGHGFRAMACSALSESGLWSKEAIEKQMSHQERNSVRAAYIHKAEYLEERIAMMQWWADYLDANTGGYISPYQFASRLKKVS